MYVYGRNFMLSALVFVPPASTACETGAGKGRKRRRAMVVLKRLIACCLFLTGMSGNAQAAPSQETVILLHGIARTGGSMRLLEKALKKQGYQTLRLTYPSTRLSLDDIAAELHKNHLTENFWKNSGKVHFVTHSMGGLVTRRYLDKYKDILPLEKIGRVVMLGPPNKGSDVADLLHELWPYQWFYGPAGSELTTKIRKENVENIYYDVGIVAGTKDWPYVPVSLIMPGESDGLVSVEHTKLDGMKDHLCVSATHTFLMNKTNVQKQVIHFLKNGKFEHEQQ